MRLLDQPAQPCLLPYGSRGSGNAIPRRRHVTPRINVKRSRTRRVELRQDLEVLALGIDESDLRNRRAKVRRKDGTADIVGGEGAAGGHDAGKGSSSIRNMPAP
ncbi:hypothetical protein E1286_45465 [Nonomuraea terrae]|uniref:Uncharacterized protein n=1 Tax=Nonomuraea terrae TaxID=2530383 RepID=A0A4R4XJX0_9ACTN|nr:hypothetical protein E1286_45465 [Nonomuraea terrae]